MKQVIATEGAPKAIGPYSQAIASRGLVFVSGQIPLDPASGTLVTGGIAEQTAQVLENVKAVLAAAGAGLADVVKTTVYLKDLSQFAAMNEVYGKYFGEKPPARATVEVARLPRDVMVEIDAVAVTGD